MRYFVNSKNSGSCVSGNLVISESRWFHVSGLDDNYNFHPKRIEMLVNAYSPKYAFVVSNQFVVSKRSSSLCSVVSRKIDDPCYSEMDFIKQNVLNNRFLLDEFVDVSSLCRNDSYIRLYSLLKWFELNRVEFKL